MAERPRLPASTDALALVLDLWDTLTVPSGTDAEPWARETTRTFGDLSGLLLRQGVASQW